MTQHSRRGREVRVTVVPPARQLPRGPLGFVEPPLGTTTFRTLDNGGSPFAVMVVRDEREPMRVTIQHTFDESDDDDGSDSSDSDLEDGITTSSGITVVPFVAFKADRAFIGNDPTHLRGRGCCAIFRLQPPEFGRGRSTYLFIGQGIYVFNTPGKDTEDVEEIETLEGWVGNSDVVYPVAFTRNYCILFEGDKFFAVKREHLPQDASQFHPTYEHTPFGAFYTAQRNNDPAVANFKRLRNKTVIGRLLDLL